MKKVVNKNSTPEFDKFDRKHRKQTSVKPKAQKEKYPFMMNLKKTMNF